MPSLRFKPVKSKHSIEDFFLGIRFARQLSEGTHTRAIIEARRLASMHNLPAENQQSNLLLAVDPVAGLQARQGGVTPFGTFFQRFGASGAVEEEVRIERNLVGYRSGIYDRWSGVCDMLEKMILPLAEMYAEEVPLLDSAIVQYVDRFVTSDNGSVDWSELFCPSTQWVASGMIPTTTAWHSHCGRFEPPSDGQAARRLVNVNVDVGEPTMRPGAAPVHSLAILTLCTDHFARPGQAPIVLDRATFASDMRSRFDHLHDRAKEILREVLDAKYLERIGMNEASGATG